MVYLLKKLQNYRKLYLIYGLYSAIVILLNNFLYKLFKKRYLLGPIEYHKNYLKKKIVESSQSRILSGHYKNTYLYSKADWSNFDLSSQLLGCYELQVQNLIVKTQKENNLKYFINIGSADGYHTLGLLKNGIFEQAICYEIDSKAKDILRLNLKENKIEDKVLIHGEANIKQIKEDLEKIEIDKTLFLIDIEGDEFKIFSNENLNFLSKAFLIIEDHNFKVKDDQLIESFYSLMKKNFNFKIVPNGARNPSDIDNNFFNSLGDDSKFLLLSEGRKKNMNWIFLSPKNH